MRFRIRKFVWLILFLTALVFQVNAQKAGSGQLISKLSGEEAYQILLKVDLYALGGTGYAGTTSKGEEALDILLAESEPIPALRKLVQEASPEGKLYALLGLKLLNCECFKEELENLKKAPAPPARKTSYGNIEQSNVKRMSGCILFQENWLEAVAAIENEKDEVKWKLDIRKKRSQ